jgi:hypothetical protein
MLDEMTKTKTGSTRHRHEVAMKDKAFDLGYHYAWAERAKTVGYPERFAQEVLG